MAWSTRELADLAGTTVRAVRHYHDVGLLDEPERCTNGYKQYGVAHLLRLLRIKRLADLGFSLPQIAAIADTGELPREALRSLDTDLIETIERVQRARREIQQILHHAALVDLPHDIAAAVQDVSMTAANRAFLVVMSRVLEPALALDFADALRALPAGAADAEFDDLPADADVSTRQNLAMRLLPRTMAIRARVPWLAYPGTGSGAAAHVVRTIQLAVHDLYNPAQIDVLRRIGHLRQTVPQPNSMSKQVRPVTSSAVPAPHMMAAGGVRSFPGR